MGNKKVVKLLLDAKADRSIQDLKGNTAVHVAIITRDLPDDVLQLLVSSHGNKAFINFKNNEGNTALHLAVKTNNLVATRTLCTNGADVNLASNTNGYTPLHMAVADQHKNIALFLLEHDCAITSEDYSGSNALKLAKVLMDNERPTTLDIYNILETEMKKLGVFEEVNIKEEDTPDDTSDMEVDIKSEHRPVSLGSLYAKYKRLTCLPEDHSKRISEILNESGSWKTLAEHMNFGHMVRSDIFKDDPNPAGSFLGFFMANGDNMLRIRKGLVALGENEVVDILDNIVKQEPDAKD